MTSQVMRDLPSDRIPHLHLYNWDSSVSKNLDLHSRIAGSSPAANGVCFWYEPLVSLSLQIASVNSGDHGKNMKVQTSGLGARSPHGCERPTSQALPSC